MTAEFFMGVALRFHSRLSGCCGPFLLLSLEGAFPRKARDAGKHQLGSKNKTRRRTEATASTLNPWIPLCVGLICYNGI